MIYVVISIVLLGFICGGLVGYLLGRFQASLVDKIRTLKEQGRQEPTPEPEKPVVAGGAYQPPREVSTSTEKKRGAGLVETKTPELLDWENKQEIEKLSTL
jgi:hypothetical protein